MRLASLPWLWVWDGSYCQPPAISDIVHPCPKNIKIHHSARNVHKNEKIMQLNGKCWFYLLSTVVQKLTSLKCLDVATARTPCHISAAYIGAKGAIIMVRSATALSYCSDTPATSGGTFCEHRKGENACQHVGLTCILSAVKVVWSDDIKIFQN